MYTRLHYLDTPAMRRKRGADYDNRDMYPAVGEARFIVCSVSKRHHNRRFIKLSQTTVGEDILAFRADL